MSVANLITKAAPSPLRALWCQRGSENCLSTLIENGDVEAAAARIEAAAGKLGLSIVEVCRVTHGTREAAYARGEPKANPT